MDLSTFFATAAGASATLMGLLFVALQFNLEKRRSDRGWIPIARATFNMFTILFIVSLIELIPYTQTYEAQKTLFIIAATIAIFRQLLVWLPAWNKLGKNRLIHTFWLMLVPVVIYFLMIAYALQPPGPPPNIGDIEYPESTLITVLFLGALRNSWDLVLEAGLVKTDGQ